MSRKLILCLLLSLGCGAWYCFAEDAQPNDAQSNLAKPLRDFAPLVGKTFSGALKGSTPEKPLVDVSRWERAMNGQAIRILHSINRGDYGGETIIMWDANKKSLVYWYFTTAGFFTQGTMELDGSKWSSTEKVTGSSQKITEVKAVSQVMPDGSLFVKSEYLKEGAWIPGHEVTYREAPDLKVEFK